MILTFLVCITHFNCLLYLGVGTNKVVKFYPEFDICFHFFYCLKYSNLEMRNLIGP